MDELDKQFGKWQIKREENPCTHATCEECDWFGKPSDCEEE